MRLAGCQDVDAVGSSLIDKNDEEHPDAVRPVESHVMMNGTALQHVFPATSVTVILFSGAQ